MATRLAGFGRLARLVLVAAVAAGSIGVAAPAAASEPLPPWDGSIERMRNILFGRRPDAPIRMAWEGDWMSIQPARD